VLLNLILQAQSPGGFPPGLIIQLVLIVGIFYLLIFLPMRKQKKAQQTMLSSLQNGNTVLTSGGIVGTIVSIGEDDTLVLRVKPDNVKIQVSRSAVSSLVGEVKK
jgi:preprotein translocase subunit YajC